MTSVTFCAYDKPDSVGGPVSWIQRLAPMLAARGIDVRCLFILHWGETGPAVEALREAGIPCEVATGVDTTEERIEWILSRLRENPPDVFVPNLVVAAYHAARWVREAGIPTVAVLHSDDPFYYAIADEFVNGEPRNRVSSVVCVSEQLEKEMLARRPGDVVVRRIPYGVTVPVRRVHRNLERLRVAYVGRLAQEQKRIGDVTRALCDAAALGGIEATIYGDGPDRGVVERILAEHPGVPVQLGGLVPSDEIQERMLDADVIVLLSDYEGLPIALLEAMACGCVPVCLDIRSGIPELVEHGVSGLLVSDRGASFVDAIRQLRDDLSLWPRLSDGARASAARFSSESSADRWAELLRDLIHPRRSREVIAISEDLQLPRVNPALASADRRAARVPALLRAYRTTRMSLGRLRRQLFARGR